MNWRVLGVAVSAALVVIAAVLLGRSIVDRLFAPDVVIEPLTDRPIVVSIEGAVASPGVAEFAVGSRIVDALAAAGGALPDADLAAINPAARLHDGDRLVVPTIVTTADAAGTPVGTYLIDLNTATATVLDTLPGIGETLSQRIVEYREANGPYQSIDDLLEVDGISESTIDEIRPLVTVGG